MKIPEAITLEGRFVRLEPLGERHRADLEAAAAQDPATFAYMGASLQHLGWEAWLRDALEGPYVAWATVDVAANLAVGSTRFGDIAVGDERLEIGWTWIAPSHQRTAINTEAKLLQLTYAFETLGVDRVALKTDARNERSQRAVERLGAVREGVLRHHMRMPDGFARDTVYYSILAGEWPRVQARLEELLTWG